MDVKGFLIPDLRKIILFAVIGVPLFFVEWQWIPRLRIPECCDFSYNQGLPFPVFYWGTIMGLSKTIIPLNLVGDIVVWYLLSCLAISGYDKFKSKN